MQSMQLGQSVTPADLEAQVSSVQFIREGVLTICVMRLVNGYMLTGESACADPLNYDQATGERIARANALNKLWPLLGYQLRDRLFVQQEATYIDRLRGEYRYVASNIERLRNFMLTPAYLALEECDRDDLKTQYEIMLPYMEIVHKRLSRLGA